MLNYIYVKMKQSFYLTASTMKNKRFMIINKLTNKKIK